MSVIATGRRVVLRDRIPSDLESYLRWQSEGEWRAYDAPWETQRLLVTSEEKSRFSERFLDSCQEAEDFPRKRATIVTMDGKPLGWVNRYANERFRRACCVGIDICEDQYLGVGLGTEALGLWVDHLFAASDLHRIGIDTWSLNPRMQRVAEKLGFRFEGAERQLIEWKGEWLDRHHYGLLRDEWEEARSGRT